jgi:hypothetical protein
VRKPYIVKDVVPRVSDGKTGHRGSCTHCGKPATKEALFKVDGVVVIEKYCDTCMEPKEFERLQEIYSRVH